MDDRRNDCRNILADADVTCYPAKNLAIIEGNYVQGEASQDFTVQVKTNNVASYSEPLKKFGHFWMDEEMIA